MKSKEIIIELRNTEDQIHCSPEDYSDIHDLLVSALALTFYTNRKIKLINCGAYLFHGMAITDGIIAIKHLQNNSRNGALLYIILFAMFGTYAFSQQKIANNYKQQRNQHKNRYNDLKKILKNSDNKTIHQITQQYRKEIPDIKSGDPDAIKTVIDHIIMRYQR